MSGGQGICENGDGSLVVPFRDQDGHVMAVRVVRADGKTQDLGAVGRAGLSHVFGGPIVTAANDSAPGPIIVMDDLAAGARVHAATKRPVAVAIDGAQAEGLSKVLSGKHPDRRVVLVESAVGKIGEGLSNREGLNAIRGALAARLEDNACGRWQAATEWAAPVSNALLRSWKVRGFGVKDSGEGGILVPLRTPDGRIEDVLAVGADGKERRLQSGTQDRLYHLIDPGRTMGEGTVVVARGYAEAAAIHQATRVPVAMVPEDGSVAAVADAIRERHGNHRIVVSGIDAAEVLGHAVRVDPDAAGRSFHRVRMENGFVAVRRAFADIVGDHAFTIWDNGSKDMAPPAPGLRRRDDPQWRREKGRGEWVAPFYDRYGRLTAVALLEGDLTAASIVGDDAKGEASNTVGFRKERSAEPIVIAEDYRSAVALHRASGVAVVAALDVSHLEAVAKAQRRKHPDVPIVIAVNGTPGAEVDVRRSLANSAARAVEGRTLSPEDLDPEATDFGELSARTGMRNSLAAVLRNQIPNSAVRSV